MNQVDIKRFRESNKILQKELSDYLGVTRAFISLVETGKSKLPADKVSMLLTNDRGWDVSFLKEAEPTTPDVDVTALLATIASQQETIATLSRMLEESQKGKSSDAQLEEDARCADAGCA